MKAILKFDLNDPDDIMAHERAVKSLDIVLVLWEFVYNTKKEFEAKLDEGVDPQDVLDMVYSKLWDLMAEKGISLDSLVV